MAPSTAGSQATYSGNHSIIWSIPEWQQATLGRWRFGLYVPVDETTVMVFKMDLDDQDSYTEFDLSTIAGNPLGLPLQDPDDGHYSVALGVDGLGRLTVTGNAHNDPIRAVVSTNPLDITAWTDISATIGALLTSGPGTPLNDTTYHQFVVLMDGTLLWFLDRGKVLSGGARDILQLRRGPAATTWTLDGAIYYSESSTSPAPAGESVRSYQFGPHCVDDGTTFGRFSIGAAYVTDVVIGQPFERPTLLQSTDGCATYLSLNQVLAVTPGSNPMTFSESLAFAPLERDQSIVGNAIAEDPANGFLWFVGNDVLTDLFQMFYWDPQGGGWAFTPFDEPGFSCPTMHVCGDRLLTVTCSNTPPFRVRLRQIDGTDGPTFPTVAEVYLGDIMPRDGTVNPMPDPIALREGRFETLVMDGDVPRIFGFGEGWGRHLINVGG